MRKITVYSTKGKSNAEITTDVATWGELKPLLVSEGYDLDSLNATENINRTDLINTGAILPEGEFTLFLRPKQTKSGADVDLDEAGFRELREIIKSFNAETKREYLESLNGENYTIFPTEKLRQSLKDFLLTLVQEIEEEEAEEDLVNVCDSNPIDVLQVIVDTLECINVSQDNDEINTRCHFIYDEIRGIENALKEQKDLKQIALDEEALDILKGYKS